MSGRFITFEGVEGSGKSTQLARLYTYLHEQRGLAVHRAHEPGEGLGPELRSLMLERAQLQPWTIACLMSGDRCEHVARTIKPALDRDEWVLCDRYTDSTLAYQGGGLGLPMDALRVLNRQATGDVSPDLTLVFDLEIEQALARVRARSAHRKLDRFESEERSFHERVRATYREIAKAEPKRVCVIDAGADPDAVFALVREAVDPLFASAP